MDTIKYKFNLDCNKIGIQRTLQGIQTGDVMARQCVISLTAGSQPLEFPNDDTVTAMMYVSKTGSATPSINACEINITSGTVTYDILPSDIESAGIVTMQLKIVSTKNNEERILVAPRFEMEIEPSTVSDSAAEATTSYTALTQALAQAQEVYNSRLTSVTVDDDYNIVVTYADGETYESTGIVDAVEELMEDKVDELEAIKAEAELYKTAAASSATAASTSATNASTSATSASESASTATSAKESAAQYLEDTRTVKAEAIAATNTIKEDTLTLAAAIKNQTLQSADVIKNTSMAYAIGETDDGAVGADHPAYHNNAKYYADLAGATADAQYVSWGAEQDLTTLQKSTARGNIGAAEDKAATTTSKGLVKPDGDTITIDADGTLHGNNTSSVELTMAEYNALPSSKLTDDVSYFITDADTEYDDEIDDDSENAVQNKVIASQLSQINSAIQGKAPSVHSHFWSQISDAPSIPTVDSALDDESTNAIQNSTVFEALSDKISKLGTVTNAGRIIQSQANGDIEISSTEVSTLLTTSNSKPVVFSSTSPSDTTALWVK